MEGKFSKRRAEFLEWLSKFIRDYRKEKGLTQEDFAEQVGVGIRTIRRIESCERNVSSVVLYDILRNIGEEYVSKFLKGEV